MSKRRMTEVSTDLASITLTDHRGRTLLRFHKEKRGWCVSDFVPRHNPAHKARPRDFAPDRLNGCQMAGVGSTCPVRSCRGTTRPKLFWTGWL